MISPISYIQNTIAKYKRVKPLRYIYIQDSVPDALKDKLEPCMRNFLQLSEKYNLNIDIVTFFQNEASKKLYITNKQNNAILLINKEIASEINSNMKYTDILRKFYELVSCIIKK